MHLAEDTYMCTLLTVISITCHDWTECFMQNNNVSCEAFVQMTVARTVQSKS